MKSNSQTKNLDHHYYFEQIAPMVRESLSYEQEQEIISVLKRAVRIPSKKIIELKTTFWFFKRLYLVIYLGRDIRTPLRNQDLAPLENLSHLILKNLIYITIILALIICLLFLLYTIKSAAGINIMPNLHFGDALERLFS